MSVAATEQQEQEKATPKYIRNAPYPVGHNVVFEFGIRFDEMTTFYKMKAFPNDAISLQQLSEISKIVQTYKGIKLLKTESDATGEKKRLFIVSETVQAARAVVGDKEQEFTRDEVLAWLPENIAPAYFESSNYSIRVVKNTDPFYALANKKTQVEFSVTAGSEDNPRHVFKIVLTREDDKHLEAFDKNYSRTDDAEVNGDLITVTSWTDYAYAAKRFDVCFLEARNVSVEVAGEMVDYIEDATPRDNQDPVRKAFLENLDPLLKEQIYVEMIEHLKNPLGKPRPVLKKSLTTTLSTNGTESRSKARTKVLKS